MKRSPRPYSSHCCVSTLVNAWSTVDRISLHAKEDTIHARVCMIYLLSYITGVGGGMRGIRACIESSVDGRIGRPKPKL